MTPLASDDPRHGTPRGYALKCRCESCKVAQSAKSREYRAANLEKIRAAELAKHHRRYSANHSAELERRAWLSREVFGVVRGI